MSGLKVRKGIEPPREDAAELTKRLQPIASTLPSALAPIQEADLPASMSISFRASPQMAKLIHQLSLAHGGVRVVVAKLLQQTGHEVGPADLTPVRTRRNYDY